MRPARPRVCIILEATSPVKIAGQEEIVPFELGDTETGVTIQLSATSREEAVRDLLAGLLQAAYTGTPQDGTADGQFVPVQAVGETFESLMADLVRDTLEAVRQAPGTLLPPRWLAFDEKRVTANLAMVPTLARRRGLRRPDLGPALKVESPLPALRATIRLDVAHGESHAA